MKYLTVYEKKFLTKTILINSNLSLKKDTSYSNAYNNAINELIFVVYSPSLEIAITVYIPKASIPNSYYYFGGGIPTSTSELYQAQIHINKSNVEVAMLKNGVRISDVAYDIYYR